MTKTNSPLAPSPWLMKIAAVCCTFLRPKHLGRIIRCFEAQDYPAEKRELVVLDDAGQYDNQQGDRWRLISTNRRFATLGEKRNAATAMVSEDVEAVAVWDDDDLYLPWALRASAAALQQAPWSRPSLVLHPQTDGSLRQHETGGLFHGGWAYHRKDFERVGGYPALNNGEDQALARRFRHADVKETDPIQQGYQPFYVYAWGAGSGWHLSAMGGDGYQRLARPPFGRCPRREKTQLVVTDPPNLDLHNPRILPGVHPRMF